ncbi:MAG: RNA methyltransferase [Caldimonas sp.]
MPKIQAISSRENPLLAQVRRLIRQPDAYRKHAELWLEGEHLGRAFIQRHGGTGTRAVVSEAAWDEPGLRELATHADSVAIVPATVMRDLSTLDNAAPIGFVVAWPGSGAVQRDAPSVVLDRLQDAGNVGTILRSAAAFGFTQVVALEGTAALWSPKVLRAAMGAHFALNLVERMPADGLDALAVPMLATSSHAGTLLPSATLPWPCAWLVGHEGRGVADDLVRRCAATLRIPQPGGEESLNAAIAASICLYESARRRLVA